MSIYLWARAARARVDWPGKVQMPEVETNAGQLPFFHFRKPTRVSQVSAKSTSTIVDSGEQKAARFTFRWTHWRCLCFYGEPTNLTISCGVPKGMDFSSSTLVEIRPQKTPQNKTVTTFGRKRVVNYLQQKLNMKPKDGGEWKMSFLFKKGWKSQVFSAISFRGKARRSCNPSEVYTLEDSHEPQ